MLTTFDRDHRPPGHDGPASDWAKRLLVEEPGQRRVNVHARVDGRPNQRYSLLFRDYLRAHPEAVKDPVADLIMVAAEEWANRTGWAPGPSDA